MVTENIATAEPRRHAGLLRWASSPLGNRELELDVVRGTAILLAMGWHLGGNASGLPVLETLFWPSRHFGWAGVDLFFVLSGFLVGRLVFREIVNSGHFDSKRFLVRRIFKLWPVYYLFLLAQLLVAAHPWQSFFIQNFFHLQNYLGSSLAHLWSLAVEEHFYLAVAIAFPLLIRSRLTAKRIVILLICVMVVPLILRIIGVAVGDSPVHLQSLTHYRIDALAVGVLLAVLSVYYPQRFARLLRLRPLWAIIVIAAIVWMTLVVKQSPLGSSLGYTIAWAGGAAFMLLFYKAGIIARLRWILRPIGILGVYSYAIYLWHISAARLAEQGVQRFIPGLSSPVVLLLVDYFAAIAVAIVMTRLIEWPSLKLRNRLFPPRARALDPAPPAESTMRQVD